MTDRDETYTLGYGRGSMEWMTTRTADRHGAFLLRYLQPGMRFLDCGCGPGTLTIGFARHVAPGETVGIDRDIEQTATVAKAARQDGIDNLRFTVGDVYDLPFEDETFDAVFASAVLGSVGDAGQVVAEMTRVLKPGGVCALKEFDHGGDIIWPLEPLLEKSVEHYLGIRAHNGHEPHAGRKLKGWLAEHGCNVDYVNGYYEQFSTPEELSWYVERNNRLFHEQLGPQYYELGWTTPGEMELTIEAWRRFARNPDAIHMAAWVEAVGIKRRSR